MTVRLAFKERGRDMRIQLTEEAASKVREFLGESDIPDGGVRLAVLPGGCSGFEYGINLEDAPEEDDVIIEQGDGLNVFVDPFSSQYLDGLVVDYRVTMMGSGFVFQNPNAAGGCGCGSSFTI